MDSVFQLRWVACLALQVSVQAQGWSCERDRAECRKWRLTRDRALRADW